MKRLFSIFTILVFFLLPLGSHVALAEDTKTEEKQEQKGARISENLFSGYTDGIYKDKYYEIDTYQPKEEDKNVFEKGWGYLFGDDSMGKDLQRMLYTTCQWFANMAFQLNVILGQLTIFLVDQALNLDIVDAVADKLGAAMQNIAGIGKGGFLSSGLFPAIIGIACVLSACYAGYIFFIKRQPSKGLSELVKTVLVIAFIVTYIGNASTILKSANTISSEISVTVLAKATGTVAGDPGRSKADAIFSVKKQIWDLLVERPYLFLQYGEDSKEKLGAQRVDELLAKSPGKERNEIVGKEVKKGNQMMVLSSVGERLVFTVMYYVVNTFAGVPVIAFCLLIVAFQLWFLVMSIISPIVMAVALLPGHRRVIESWASQWIRPLALKIFMSVMLVIIFTVAELLYVLPAAGVAGYVSTMIFQILVFVLCYIFRGNIVAAFSRARGVYETVTNISLMTENFVDKGKEYAGNTMSYIGDKMGMHFNNAAELAASGGQLENAGTDDEKTKNNPLVQANIPNDLPNNQTEQEKEENQKKGKLISLQDRDKDGNLPQQEEEGKEQTIPGEEEAPMQQDLISLDKEALEQEVEGTEVEGTEVEESEMDVQPELVSLENEEIPTEEEIPADIEGYEEIQPEVPEQEVSLEDIPTDIEVYEEVQPEVPEQEVPLEEVSSDMEAYEEIQTEVPGQEIPLEEVSSDMEAYEEIQTEVPTQELPLEEVSTDHEAYEEIPSDIPQQDIPTEEIPMDISREEIQPEQETSTHIPQQEISTPIETESNDPLIPDTIRADVNEEGVIVPHTPETTSADIPDAIPAEVNESGEIVAKKPNIDVESTVQVTNSSDSFIPTESISPTDLTRVNEKEVSKNEPIQGEVETIDTPDIQYGAVAAGSENWMPSTDPQNLDNLDDLEPPKKDE
ncbi:CD3337/EF1877 family mobilome membrane protein [Bacillus cereus]|uniref:CD3337/EF1877 family mobilome membrane protein n=1 Tax=Bacillus cereus TaxID=1396 RepID=UPI002ABFA6CE|nr:CPBP family intramembrane glutamate endopeptidase [Bacillus cereus]MDZ4572164.1 CPBP family intramembrane metalloprotease [Bacillus cereus]